MLEVRIISDPQDSSPCPATRTLNDAISKLLERGELLPDSRLRLLARSAPDRPNCFPALLFRSSKGDDALFALPASEGCYVMGTLGARTYMTLDRLDGAEVDCEGNVELRGGTFVHAVSFETLSLHYELPELEETIVYLTIRCLKAESQCIRNDHRFRFGIDYSALPHLSVSNIKKLALYVNSKIADVSRINSDDPPFGKISYLTIKRTLDLVGIQKVLGRPKKRKKRTATASP